MAEHQTSLARAVGQRECRYLEAECRVQFAAALQQRAGLAAGFIGEHVTRSANQMRHRQAVGPQVGADVDGRHSWLQPMAKKNQLLFEPGFLFEQNIRRDGLQARWNRERYAVGKLELECIQCDSCRF